MLPAECTLHFTFHASSPCQAKARYAAWPQGVEVVSCRGEGPDARTRCFRIDGQSWQCTPFAVPCRIIIDPGVTDGAPRNHFATLSAAAVAELNALVLERKACSSKSSTLSESLFCTIQLCSRQTTGGCWGLFLSYAWWVVTDSMASIDGGGRWISMGSPLTPLTDTCCGPLRGHSS